MCDTTAGVILADLDLAGNGSKILNVSNQTVPGNLDVTLTESPPSSGLFKGDFDLVTSAEAGKLLANHGDQLFVQYSDADDGTGNPATVNSTAQLDCTVPQVTNFIVSDHTAFSLVLNFSFNKKVSGILKYGTTADPGSLSESVPLDELSLHHTLEIGGLNPCTVYYAALELVDHVGNINTDDNTGSYYSFQTLEDEPIFFDDLDLFYNQNNFTHGSIQGTDDFTRIDDASNSYSPTHAMRSEAIPSVKDIYLKTKNVTVKAYSRLTFYHKFSMEPGFDGAVVEISTDNGLHWRDLGNYITEGKYNAMIALFSGNPLMARLAWTYAWDNGQVEFRRSWIDLHDFRNKPVQIRFRLATDDSIILPNSAWYIDDVKISYDSDCQDTLFMRLNRSNYGPSEAVNIRVFDPSLPSASSVNVTVSSETEPGGETVSLSKTANNVYEGSITTKNGGAASDSLISCTDGDIISVLYSSSANGGSSNPDQAQAKAFYFLPSLFLSPPLNEGVNKVNNNVEKALVFPVEFSPRGADIVLKSIKFALTDDSQLDPVAHIAADGMNLYLDTNYDKAYTEDDVNPGLSDELLANASINPDGSVTFSGLDLTLSRDDTPRLFLMAHLTENVPFGTRFQFEIPDLNTDITAQLVDTTSVDVISDRDPKGFLLKVISRALLVNQSAPTIYLEDGETWETAFHTIGDALIEANNRASRSKLPVELWVARGRYQELLREGFNKAVQPNVELYGGFGGDESNKDDPRRYIMETFIEYPHRDDAEEYNYDYWAIVEIFGGTVIDGFHILGDYNYNNERYSDMKPWTTGIYCRNSDGREAKIRNCIFRNLREYAITAYDNNQCPNSVVSNCIFAYLRNAPVPNIGSGTMFINCSFFNTAQWNVNGKNYYFYNCAWDSSVHEGSFWKPQVHLIGGSDEFNRVRNCFLPYGGSLADIFGDDRENQKESPQWINPDYLDFRLTPGSPAIDAGRSEDNTKPELAQEFPPLDIRGDDRIIGSSPDVGALEMTSGKPMYYIKNVTFGDDTDPLPIVFRPDQPVSLRMTIGSYNMPVTLVTLGGRISLNDRYFQLDKSIGMFAPKEGESDLEQIKSLPFTLTLTGNPPVFYNLKFTLDFLKTDGTDEVVDTAFYQLQLPAFIDPVNGDDTNRGGIREPLKTMSKALYYLAGQNFKEDPQIYVAQGTLAGADNQIWNDNWNWHYWPTIRVEFLGGFNPRTWERDPKAFETIWDGEDSRRFLFIKKTFAFKVDGFTFKNGIEHAIEVYFDHYASGYGYDYFGSTDITNNIFKNNNGNSAILYQAYAGRYDIYNGGVLRYNPVRSSVGAPLSNAGDFNGSVLFSGRGCWEAAIDDPTPMNLEEFTIEAWINPRNLNPMNWDSLDQAGVICRVREGSNDFIHFFVNNDKKLYARIKNDGWDWDGVRLNAPDALDPAVWHHVAVTLKKDSQDDTIHTAYLYHNGSLVAEKTQTKPSSFSINPTRAHFGPLDGCLDEARIWNKPLSEAEIAANMNKELSSSFGLVCAFHFNEESGSTTQSSTGGYQSTWYHPWPQEKPALNVSNNIFEDNKAVALHLYKGAGPTLVHNNVFQNNQNRFLYMNDCYLPFLQVSNNAIIENSPPDQASLLYCPNIVQNIWVIGNTIANNQAKVFEAERDSGSNDVYHINCILNNIIWGNTGVTNVDAANVSDIPGRFVYNLIPDADAGDPQIDPPWAQNFTCVDPDFDADGYHILSTSCARAMGPDKTLAAAPPSAFIKHNFWNIDNDIDDQERPEDDAWDVGADQYGGPGSAVVKARLISGSTRLAGIPFDIDLKLTRNYDNAPAGFSFRVQYPEGTVTELTASAGDLGAAPTVGGETSAGAGKVYREVSAIPGNTGNTERNPQLVQLSITMKDPYPELVTVEILPPVSGAAVQDSSSAEIPVTIDDSLLENMYILAPNPVANFSAIPTRGLVNPDASLFLPVYFQDASLGYVTSWEWNFGDLITSTDTNPMHEYIQPGTYTVTLTVEGPYGKSEKTRVDYIVASDPRNPPVANFTADPFNSANQRVEGPAPLRVEFLDATNGPTSTFQWNFGDTNTSNAQNPTHIYETQGDYTVTLSVDGPMGPDSETKTNYIHVTAPESPNANFNVDKPFGFAPHNVNFTNNSTGSHIQFYYYDFGDGNWSQDENPDHKYVLPGTYNATLTIAGASGFDLSDPKPIEVDQAFPHKTIIEVLCGKKTVTPTEKASLDFNQDGILDVADVVWYLSSLQ